MGQDVIEMLVSDEHIKCGQSYCCGFRSTNCAVALAAQDMFGENFNSVGFRYIFCASDYYELDEKTMAEIERMDKDRKYIPKAFTAILTKVKE